MLLSLFFSVLSCFQGAADSGRGGGAEDSPEFSSNVPEGRAIEADDGRRRSWNAELAHLLQQRRDSPEVRTSILTGSIGTRRLSVTMCYGIISCPWCAGVAKVRALLSHPFILLVSYFFQGYDDS